VRSLRNGVWIASAVGASLGQAQVAHAAPNWHIGWQPEWCLTGTEGAFFEESSFCTHVVGDVVFGRKRDRDVGFGLYSTVGTADFADVRLEGGVTSILPIDPTYPLSASLGLVAHGDDGEFEPGVGAWLLWGPRSYNFHSSYSPAGGVVVGFERSFGSRAATTLSVGIALDGMWLALPFIAGYEWLRGAPD
jgi:hypothetical protein